MSEAEQRATKLTLAQVCEQAEPPDPSSVTVPAWRNAAVRELIRRAKEMEAHLSPKPEKPDGPPPMPEPVEIWLGELGHGFAPCGPHHPTAIGPYQIIPGMMSLDELREHGFTIEWGWTDKHWRIFEGRLLCQVSNFRRGYPTFPIAQWTATQIAKRGGAWGADTKGKT